MVWKRSDVALRCAEVARMGGNIAPFGPNARMPNLEGCCTGCIQSLRTTVQIHACHAPCLIPSGYGTQFLLASSLTAICLSRLAERTFSLINRKRRGRIKTLCNPIPVPLLSSINGASSRDGASAFRFFHGRNGHVHNRLGTSAREGTRDLRCADSTRTCHP